MSLIELSQSLDITHKILLIVGAAITIASPFIYKVSKYLYKRWKVWVNSSKLENDLVLSKLSTLEKSISDVFHLSTENKKYNKINEQLVHEIILKVERMEARLATQGDAFTDPIFRCDLDGKNTYINRAYCRLLGVSKERLMGMGWQTFIRPDRLEDYSKIWKNALHNSVEIINLPLVFTKDDGTDIEIWMNLRPVRNGKIHEFFGNIEVINSIQCNHALKDGNLIKCPITGFTKEIHK